MKADRVIATQLEEPVQRRSLSHVVLSMHLEEAEFGPGGGDLCQVRRPQADTRAPVRDRSTLGHCRDPARCLGQLLLRLPPSILAQVPAGT